MKTQIKFETVNPTEAAIIRAIEGLINRERSLPIDSPNLQAQDREIDSNIAILAETLAIGRGVESISVFGFVLPELNDAIEEFRFSTKSQ